MKTTSGSPLITASGIFPGCRPYRAIFAALAPLLCSIALVGLPTEARPPWPAVTAAQLTAEEGRPPRQGYLLNLELRSGRTSLSAAAEIDNYVEGRHPVAEDDWHVLLFTHRGECIGSRRIGNPARIYPLLSADQAFPFECKIPRLPGLASLTIYNQYREEQLQVSLDERFQAAAAANRRFFLEHERANRLRIAEEPRPASEAAVQPRREPDEIILFEDMDGELQKKVRGEVALDMERMQQFGPEVMKLGRELGVEPEQMQQILSRSSASPPAGEAAPGFRFEAGAYTLSGQVTDRDTGLPVVGAILNFYQYEGGNQTRRFIGRQTTDSSGRYSMAVDAGVVNIDPDYSAVAGKRYVFISQTVNVAGSTVWDFKAVPGVRLSGTAKAPDGKGVGGATVQIYDSILAVTFSAATSPSGTYSIIAPSNHPLNITIVAPDPYVAPATDTGVVLTEDTIRDIRLEVGWRVTGRVLGEGGVPLQRASVLLRQLTFSTTWSPNWFASTTNGQYAFTVPKTLQPNSFVLATYATSYTLHTAGLSITGDLTWDIQLVRGYTVSGTVRDSAENPLRGAWVRAYQGGNLVNSAYSLADGSYSFDLPAGTFDVETTPPANTNMAPSLLRNVQIGGQRTLNFVLPVATGSIAVRLNFPSQEAYNRYSSWSLVRFELYQAGLTVYAGGGTPGTGGLDPTTGKYFRSSTLYVNSGKYALTAFLAGCQPISVAAVTVGGQAAVSIDVPAPFLWTGVLRGADNKPLPSATIQSYTDLARENETTLTNASGQFSILLTPGGFAKFHTSTGSNSILHTERFGETSAGRTGDVVLDAFPSFTDTGSVLTQLYGVPDRNSRWNIVMIGDGYTGVNEPFTDQNGNGRWDGVLFYDLNKNGLWESGEPYQRYGTAAAPIASTDPTRENEPFQDLNGDGIPSYRDRELFDQNTLDTARSLFGQDRWRLHREAFNIFRIRLVSNQAGHKVMDSSGKVVIDRNTALGTYLNTPERGYMFSANYTLVSQYINQYLPECDTRIVMVNQPIRLGRVNSYMFQYGGDFPALANDYTVAHEMGHNVGSLADEYTEYQENYHGPESAARNITSIVDPRHIPWRHMIRPGKEIPSSPGSAGVGLFEGASYYTSGRYRPTEYCMMVSGNRYCPVCAAEIETRLRDVTGVVPNARPLGPTSDTAGLFPQFRWEVQDGITHYLLEVEKADGSQSVASYDVYGSSFSLPAPLTAGAEYRWRIRPASTVTWGQWTSYIYFKPQSAPSLFTGIFAQIAAGGGYQTSITGINTAPSETDIVVSLFRSNGTPFESLAGAADTLHFNAKPFGIARLFASIPGGTIAGYARLSSGVSLDGTALFKTIRNGLVLSEAGVGLSKATKSFTVYIDNTDNASSGYAVANHGSAPARLALKLRDAAGRLLGTGDLPLPAGQHLPEFASERFAAARAGFQGSIEFSSDQDVAAVALRYDNVQLEAARQVFSTIPVLVNEAATALYFPQVADGSGYRTNLILLNPADGPASVRLEFFSSTGAPLSLPIGGVPRTTYDVPLSARGAARLLTDGTSPNLSVGWIKVKSDVAIGGSAIFQTRDSQRILSEAGVASSPLAGHFVTYVESLDSTESGLAICNPNSTEVTLTLNLRRETGEIEATVTAALPPNGHVASFFTEWFPRGFGEFVGTLEVISSAPVAAVALRYDNPSADVFATLPVIVIP